MFCAPALLALLAACSDPSHRHRSIAPDCALTGACDGRELWSLAITPEVQDPPSLTLAQTTFDEGVAAVFFGRPGTGLNGDPLISASDLPEANDTTGEAPPSSATLSLRIAGNGEVRRHAALPALNIDRSYVDPDDFRVGATENVFAMEAAQSVVAYDALGRELWSYESKSGLTSFSADDQGGVILDEFINSEATCSLPASARLTRLKADGSIAFSHCLIAVTLEHPAPLPGAGVVALATVGKRANQFVPALTSADFGDGQVRVVEPDGIVLVAWDAEGTLKFVTPVTPVPDLAFDCKLAVGARGDAWVLSRHRELDQQGWSRYDERGERQAGGSLDFTLGTPVIAVDSAGYAVISGERKGRDESVTQKLSPAGDVVWEKPGLRSSDLAVDRAGNIYAVTEGPKLTKFAP